LDGCKNWKKFMSNLPSVRVDDILIHPRDRDLIVGTHGRSIWIVDDISPLEHLKQAEKGDQTLFEPRPAVLWKNDPQSQRHVTNRDFVGKNPQGGTAIHILAKSDIGAGKLEFLQNKKVVSTMDVSIKGGLNSFQWNMRGPAPAPSANQQNRGGGGQARGGAPPDLVPDDPNAPWTPAGSRRPERSTEVPFVPARGGGGGFGFNNAPPLGPLLEPGTYMIRLTAGGQTLMSSVQVLDDTWMRPQ
jgi:hypothetical protein